MDTNAYQTPTSQGVSDTPVVDWKQDLKELKDRVKNLPPLPKDKVAEAQQQATLKVREELGGLLDPNRALQTRNLFLTNTVAQLENPESPIRQIMTALLPKQNMEFAQIRAAQQEAYRLKAATDNLIADTELKNAMGRKIAEEINQLRRSGELDERKLRLAEMGAILSYYETVVKLWMNQYAAAGASIGLFNKQYTDALEAMAKLATASGSTEVPREVKEQLNIVIKQMATKLGLPPVLGIDKLLWLIPWDPVVGEASKTYVELWETPSQGPKPPKIPLTEDMYSPLYGVNPQQVQQSLQNIFQTLGSEGKENSRSKLEEFNRVQERLRARQ